MELQDEDRFAQSPSLMRGLTMRDVAVVLFRRKWVILWTYLAIVLATAAYCFFWPPSYAASLRYLVNHDRAEPVISADQNDPRILTKETVTEEDMNSEMAIMQSPAVIEATARDMRIQYLTEHWAIRLLKAPSRFIRGIYDDYHHRDVPGALEEATVRVAKSLDVVPQKKSDVIEVTLTWGSPEMARAILEKLAQHYEAQHVMAHEVADTMTMFQAEAEKKRLQLDEIERQMEAIRPGATIGTLAIEKDLALRQALEFESEWHKANVLQAQAEARVSSQSSALAGMPEHVVSEDRSLLNQTAIGGLRGRVLELQLKRSELLQRYQPDNRLVREADEELAKAKTMLESEVNSPLHEQTTSLNKLSERLHEDLAADRTTLSASSALSDGMKRAYEDYQGRLRQIEKQSVTLQTLDRQRREAEDSYLLYKKRFEEARMQAQLDRTHVVNVRQLEPVWADSSPVKPNSKLLLKLALGVGLLVGLGVAFLLELLDRRLRTEHDVESTLGIPVLASFEAPTRSERSHSKSSRFGSVI
jgi:succinoglycan biosynthesis transport protein ExoP